MANRGYLKQRSWHNNHAEVAKLSAKWCVNCRCWQPAKDGQYIKFNNGMNQRWFCYQCIRRKLNAAQTETRN